MKVTVLQRLGGVVAVIGLGLLTAGALLHGGPVEVAAFGTLTAVFVVALVSDWFQPRQRVQSPGVRASSYGRLLLLLVFAVLAVGLGIRSVLAAIVGPP